MFSEISDINPSYIWSPFYTTSPTPTPAPQKNTSPWNQHVNPCRQVFSPRPQERKILLFVSGVYPAETSITTEMPLHLFSPLRAPSLQLTGRLSLSPVPGAIPGGLPHILVFQSNIPSRSSQGRLHTQEEGDKGLKSQFYLHVDLGSLFWLTSNAVMSCPSQFNEEIFCCVFFLLK